MKTIQEQAIQRAKKANAKSMRIGNELTVDIYFSTERTTVAVNMKKVRGSKPNTYKMACETQVIPSTSQAIY